MSCTKSLISKSPAAMDPTIWSQLPEEILELILSLLPLKTFFNLRSTCKRFNSLLFSPSFASKHSSISSSSSSSFSSFLLLSHPQLHTSFALFDSSRATWRDLALSLPSSSLLSSSSNGLLCLSLPNSSSFLVSNLLSKSSRVVQFPFYPFSFDSISIVPTRSGYCIFALSSSSSPNRTFVYDSDTRTWARPESPDPVITNDSCCRDKGVFFKGRLYFTTPEPFSVVWFDVESGKWERSNAVMPNDITFVRLVSVEEEERKLIMVGGVGRNGISRSLKMWELKEEEERWVEIERVPEMMCQKFMSVCYHNYQHVYCFWHKSMVCVCCFTWPDILYFNFPRRTWHWLPKCPSLPDKWSCGFRFFSFLPHLYSLP